MNSRTILILVIVLGFVISCGKTGIEPGATTMVAKQVGGCGGALGKSAAGDSCISYIFKDILQVDFCMAGNCCPDSDRFSFTHKVSQDTILIVVSDTAAHLCRCSCAYLLHAEVYNLDRNEYVLICARTDYSSRYIFYSQHIQRTL